MPRKAEIGILSGSSPGSCRTERDREEPPRFLAAKFVDGMRQHAAAASR